MKRQEIMGRLRSFFTFDTPIEMGTIRSGFAATHSQYQQLISEWGNTSTRQKLIANYWFTQVLSHFAAIVGLPAILLWPFTRNLHSSYLMVVFMVAASALWYW